MVIQCFKGANNRLSRRLKTCIPHTLTAVALLTSSAAMTEEAMDSPANSEVAQD